MVIELQRTNPLPPVEEPEKEELRFPGKLCLLAVLLLTGFYYFLIFVVPGPEPEDSTLAERCVLEVGRFAEGHCLAVGAVFIALLAPALIFREKARDYLLRLSVVLGIFWAATFTFSVNPEAKAADAVRSFLSTERPLPQTIHGR